MPMIPAFCDMCGSIFSSGIMIEGSSNVTLSNNSSGPCPNCGGMGHIPDGVFSVIGNTIQLLSGPHRTVAELQRLADILRGTRNKEVTIEEVEEQITNEVPALSGIINLLPRNRSELYSFIGLLIAIITFITPLVQNQTQSRIEINQVVNYIYQQSNTNVANTNNVTNITNISNSTNVSTNHTGVIDKKKPIRLEKTGRNEKCPCGSDKKYKNCCGK